MIHTAERLGQARRGMHPPAHVDPTGGPGGHRPGRHRADARRSRAARAGPGHLVADVIAATPARLLSPRLGPGDDWTDSDQFFPRAWPQEPTPMSSLSGKSALVTGSTSGIGLGIAGRLAAAGANGSCSTASASPPRSRRFAVQLAERISMDVHYCDADLDPGREIHHLSRPRTRPSGPWTSWSTTRAFSTSHRSSSSPGPMGLPDRAEPLGGVPLHPGGAAGDARAELGPDHQHLLGTRPGRLGATRRRTWPRSTAWSA